MKGNSVYVEEDKVVPLGNERLHHILRLAMLCTDIVLSQASSIARYNLPSQPNRSNVPIDLEQKQVYKVNTIYIIRISLKKQKPCTKVQRLVLKLPYKNP